MIGTRERLWTTLRAGRRYASWWFRRTRRAWTLLERETHLSRLGWGVRRTPVDVKGWWEGLTRQAS